jgi:hypothetical protein
LHARHFFKPAYVATLFRRFKHRSQFHIGFKMPRDPDVGNIGILGTAPRNARRGGQRADDVQINPANKHGVGANAGRLDAQALQPVENQFALSARRLSLTDYDESRAPKS